MQFLGKYCSRNKSLMRGNELIFLSIWFKMSFKCIISSFFIKLEMIETKCNIKKHTLMIGINITNLQISQKSLVIIFLGKVAIAKIFNGQSIRRVNINDLLEYLNRLVDFILLFVNISDVIHCVYVIRLKLQTK